MACKSVLKLSLIFSLWLIVSIAMISSCSSFQIGRNITCVGDKGATIVHVPECEGPDITYSTLQNVAESLSSHTTVVFCGPQIEIQEQMSFRNLTDIVFKGESDNTTNIICTQPGAGLDFSDITNLSITDLTFTGCGSLHDSTTQINDLSVNSTLQFSSAVYIIDCTHVSISYVNIFNSTGTGLVLYDTNGTVEITHSVFDHNEIENPPDNETIIGGGGGVLIEFTKCTPGIYCDDFSNREVNLRASSSQYTINNCTFSNNNAVFTGPRNLHYKDRRRLDHQGLGRGGGLAIILNGNANWNSFTIDDCIFMGNQATWGGGIYIVFQDQSMNNSIQLSHLKIHDNICKNNGGGGVELGFNTFTATNNNVTFEQCSFLSNEAMYGGGFRMYSSKSMEQDQEKSNKVKFYNCTWKNNTARFGSGVDIAPHIWEILLSGFLPTPVFENCVFESNRADLLIGDFEEYKEYYAGRGALMLTKFTANFTGDIIFNENTGCALYLSSSIISVAPNSRVVFTNNSAFQGGAIEFLGFSAMFVRENSFFYFAQNQARRRGGAIYVFPIDKHDFVSSRSCFFQYHGSVEGNNKNVTFTFTQNVARNYDYNVTDNTSCLALGHSIFSPSLKTCIYSCNPRIRNASREDTFSCIGDFSFTEDINCQVSSSGGIFSVERTKFRNGQLYIYPGRDIELPISVLNDFGQMINPVYFASIKIDDESSITTRWERQYVSDKKIQLFGQPGSNGILRLQKLGFRDLIITINVTLQKCPPGYVLSTDMALEQSPKKCVCSNLRKDHSYAPIRECNDTTFEAYLSRGYWLGYQGGESEENLRYGYCPSGYCFHNKSHDRFHTIPSSTSKDDLDKIVCGKYRTGTLCGQCRANYSVHYHSESLYCDSHNTCSYGWLLYIISELLPLTGLFVFTTLFNISFTSGAINGFILFAQVLDSLPITGKSFIVFPDAIYEMFKVNKMIYNMFNFDFFSHDSLSFCLWKGATSLDMLIFKLLTVVYAIFLVIATVVVMKYCNIFQKCPCLRYSTVKSSVIHGLSSVLVMVYSQCIKVCFQILDFTYIFSKGNTYDRDVVYVQGNFEPFSGEHIKYAVIAMICLLVIGIPQLLLLVYPVCFKILNLLRCKDSNKVARFLFHNPYSKLKPFLDSFQSCFKDDYRVFAGFYFLYRLLIISATFHPRITGVYTLLDIFLLCFLVMHAIAQPYRKRWHNILDGLLIFNLAIINKINKVNYDYSKYYADESQTDILPLTTSFQIIIINLPLVYIVVYGVGSLALCIRKCFREKIQSSSNINMNNFVGDSGDELPARMQPDYQDSDSDNGSVEYSSFDQVMYDLPQYTF